jgi:glycosyltransferase involved in cell wall biosynthesis
MKILIVAFWFPPANEIGSIRVGKLARYLDRRSHDIRVLTTDTGGDRSQPLEIPAERVVYTDYHKRGDRLGRWVRSFQSRPTAPLADNSHLASTQSRAPGRSLQYFLRRQYYGATQIPDTRNDWITTAIPAGSRLIREWKPDLIFASAPPYTALIIASRLARAFSIPWVADFRDLWVDNPYYDAPSWRRPVDAMLERLTLRNAARLVTVSPSWAATLGRRHDKPVDVIFNGYAEEDFSGLAPQPDRGEVLTMRYLGSIYRGFRDPSALFAGIGLLPQPSRRRIKVEFFCDAGDEVLAAATANHVTGSVAVLPRVPYRRALELQMQADVLLLLQSPNRRDEGNIPAKLFEYLYARRPILLIGYEHGIAARFVSERGAGLVSNSPTGIRDQLQAWLDDKAAGRLTRLDPSVSKGLSRDEQYRKLEHVFMEILNEGVSRQAPGQRSPSTAA